MEELGWKRILITFNSSQLLSGADGQADPVQDGDLWPRPAAAEDGVWHPSGGPAGAEWDINAGESQSCRPMSGDVTADYTRWNLPTWQVVSCVMDGRDERFSCLQLVYLNVLNKYGFNHLDWWCERGLVHFPTYSWAADQIGIFWDIRICSTDWEVTFFTYQHNFTLYIILDGISDAWKYFDKISKVNVQP